MTTYLRILPFLAALACNSNDSPDPDRGGTDTGTPDETGTVGGVGSVLGAPVKATIDGAGGTLISADGLFVLSVPAGAIATPTEISVQPITNTLPGGRGIAARLQPEGLTFAKPATLGFRYGTGPLVGGVPEALRVAFQDGDGRWHEQPGSTLDDHNGTIWVDTTHLSDWAAGLGFWLVPRTSAIGTADTLALEVVDCLADDADLVPERCDPGLGVVVSEWAVDGAAGGNASSGVIVDNGDGMALYTAPSRVPATNPVTVSARVEAGGPTYLLVASVHIVDGPTWVGAVETTQVFNAGSGAITTRTRAEVAFLYSAGAGYHVPQGNLAGDIHVQNTLGDCESRGWSASTILPDQGSLVVTGDQYVAFGLTPFYVPADVPGESTCNDQNAWEDEPMLYTALNWFPLPGPQTFEGDVMRGTLTQTQGFTLTVTWRLDRVEP